MTIRPRRSALYMPGSNARALEKAATLPADGLILDLEDAVAPDAKDLARKQVCEAVKARRFGKRNDKLARNIEEHSPHPRDDFLAENRVVIAAQEVAQDRHDIGHRAARRCQLFCQQRLVRACGSAGRCGVSHGSHS